MAREVDATLRRAPVLLRARPWIGVVLGVISFSLLSWAVLTEVARTSQQREDTTRWELHTQQVQVQTQLLLNAVLEAETGQRGYLLSGDRRYLAPYLAGASVAQTHMDELQRLTKDNADQQARLSEIERLLRARMARLAEVLEKAENGNRGVAILMLRDERNRIVMQELRDNLDDVWRSESALLQQRRADSARAIADVHRSSLMLGALALVLIVALGLASVAAARSAGEVERRTAEAEVSRRVQAELQHRVAEALEAQSKTEAALRQSQKMEAVGQLAGGVAHDFNNLLAVIIGSLDMAQRRLANGDTDIKRFLANAIDGARRAAALTQRILAFSRRQPLEPKVQSLNRVVSDMSELLHRTLGEQVKLETVLASGLWTSKVDAHQLENVILNLAVNARDAMPSGGALTIETGNAYLDDAYVRDQADVEAGQYVFVAVTDTGAGMSEEVIAKAFEPFFTTKGLGKGTGLGLSQAFGFVKQSGGHIKIYSEIGQGTTIKVYLPRWTGDQTLAETRRPAGELPRGRAEETILVVEDDDKVRLISVESLRELGYGVLQAATGAEAMAMLAQNPGVNLLFTDVVLPDLNGRQLAEDARKTRPDLKVLFTTGYTRNAIVHNGVLDAHVAFLAKPFTLEQLAEKIRNVLNA